MLQKLTVELISPGGYGVCPLWPREANLCLLKRLLVVYARHVFPAKSVTTIALVTLCQVVLGLLQSAGHSGQLFARWNWWRFPRHLAGSARRRLLQLLPC